MVERSTLTDDRESRPCAGPDKGVVLFDFAGANKGSQNPAVQAMVKSITLL
jgi:hypothetical protein